jgi:ubiquinone/menaquinone biosynthesis C-methylase UbiE
MTEFTGERVIPGQVNPDLWAEHVARYAFAARFAGPPRALDIACGTGYGTAEIARRTPMTVGIDIAQDAIAYARENFPAPHFLRAVAGALPFASGSFESVTAFEVIEHLDHWQSLLEEAHRVLAPRGVFIVSTPNKLYYTESRAEQGANPFHVHEFEYDEFQSALAAVFPYVHIFLQNRTDAFAFSHCNASPFADAEFADGAAPPAEAGFFIAVCSVEPLRIPRSYLYVPAASNLLRERERHIRLLEQELDQVRTWLGGMTRDRDQLLEKHAGLEAHLEHQNKWAQELERNWNEAAARVVQLQDELASTVEAYEKKVASLEEENLSKTQWALDTEERLSTEIENQKQHLAEAVKMLDSAQAAISERTAWAKGLDLQLQQELERIDLIRQSRWIRMGRLIGLGPQIDPPPQDGE